MESMYSTIISMKKTLRGVWYTGAVTNNAPITFFSKKDELVLFDLIDILIDRKRETFFLKDFCMITSSPLRTKPAHFIIASYFSMLTYRFTHIGQNEQFFIEKVLDTLTQQTITLNTIYDLEKIWAHIMGIHIHSEADLFDYIGSAVKTRNALINMYEKTRGMYA